MKKVVSFLLVLAMLMFGYGAVAELVMEDEENGEVVEEVNPIFQEDYEQYVNWDIAQELIVGGTSQMSGNFFTDMWGNNTSDVDVRTLLHGYHTVAWGRNGAFVLDEQVIVDVSATDDAAGNRTYTFTIAEDLTYNDGTPITAKDYVFSVLLVTSPVLTEFGGVPTAYQHLLGYEAFRNDAPFAGVRLLDTYVFSLTIAAANLPYYFELALVNVNPYPMAVIAPGCDVLDDGAGAYIDGPFTPELMEETVLAAEGYLHQPKITCGPFTLVEYDAAEKIAVFEKNELYKGNYEGWIPFIEKLTLVYADPITMMEEFKAGELDLINKVSRVEAFNEVREMQAAEEARIVEYWRSGFSFLSFACELGLTESVNVRKAVAMSVDVQDLIEGYVPGFGMSVFGYYGLGQWMAAQSLEELEELALYGYNPQGAKEALMMDGWVLNADGGEYDEAQGGTRYRLKENGDLEELVLKYANAKDNPLSEMVGEMLEANLPEIGMRIETTSMPFSELLLHYYRQTDRTYNMFSLATNFSMIFDPYYAFSTDEMFQGVFNTTGIADEKLMNLAENMRRTVPGDDMTYLEKWMEFQKYWVEVLPMAPFYSNIYADFTRPDLRNYASNANFSWASAIVYSYLGEEYADLIVDDGGADTDELVFQ